MGLDGGGLSMLVCTTHLPFNVCMSRILPCRFDSRAAAELLSRNLWQCVSCGRFCELGRCRTRRLNVQLEGRRIGKRIREDVRQGCAATLQNSIGARKADLPKDSPGFTFPSKTRALVHASSRSESYTEAGETLFSENPAFLCRGAP